MTHPGFSGTSVNLAGKLNQAANSHLCLILDCHVADHVGVNFPTRFFIENVYNRIANEELGQYIADYEARRPSDKTWESK